MDREEITLEIDGFTPATLPMARLAQYLSEFSELLGHEANVHFLKLVKGSSKCRAYADHQVAPKVRERIESIVDGTAPKPAMKAHAAIDDLLAADNAIGGIYLGKQQVIEFPGRRRATKERIGPVRRSTSLEGQIFSIGGKDATINVHLRNKQESYRCEVSIDLARKLAPYFLNGAVRIFGHGDWYRVDSIWEMSNFVGVDFVELECIGLREAIDELRRDVFSGVPANGLLTDLDDLRRG